MPHPTRRHFLATTASLLSAPTIAANTPSPPPKTPKLSGDWVQIASSPELPEINSPAGQVVDHAIFKAPNGRWQLWMQIRGTAVGRLFYRLEGGKDLLQPDWTPHGICWRADRAAGESKNPGKEDWIHAPYIMKYEDQFIMYYGGGHDTTGEAQMSIATSTDGIEFTRDLDANGKTAVCVGPGYARDAMVLKVGDKWVMYYAADINNEGVIAARTSPLPIGAPWSDYQVVSKGGICGTNRADQQCPYVIHRDGLYYLFKMGPSNKYETAVYYSQDPFDFGKDDDQLLCVLKASAAEVIETEGRYYLSSLIPGYKGVRLSALDW